MPLLVAHTTLLEISGRGSFNLHVLHLNISSFIRYIDSYLVKNMGRLSSVVQIFIHHFTFCFMFMYKKRYKNILYKESLSCQLILGRFRVNGQNLSSGFLTKQDSNHSPQ